MREDRLLYGHIKLEYYFGFLGHRDTPDAQENNIDFLGDSVLAGLFVPPES